jgi:hypothetical protein
MKHARLTTYLVLGCLAVGALAQKARGTSAAVNVREGQVEGHADWRFVDVTVDLKHIRLKIAFAPGGEMLKDMIPEGALVVVNGGYFDANFRPTGWVRDQGREYAPKVSRKSGGVLAVKGSDAYMGPVSSISFKADFAVQNGPLLIEPNGNIGIRVDDGRRAARTVACLVGGKAEGARVKGTLHWILLLSKPHAGPTLMETAKLLKKPVAENGFGCSIALNLDGGPSTGVWMAPHLKVKASPPTAPIGYAIAVLPSRRSPSSKPVSKPSTKPTPPKKHHQ